jgi:hypothetical protein
MSENRQVSVVVDNLVTFSSAGQNSVNLHTAGVKDWKLDLRHGPLLFQTIDGRQKNTGSKSVSFSFCPHLF